MSNLDDESLPPVFIVSPTTRSGTNFLLNVLVELALCERPEVDVLTREDFLLLHADRLRQYAEETANCWRPWEPDEAKLKLRSQHLLKSIGDGILRFVGTPADSHKRLAVKTPNPRHLSEFPDLFPEAKLLLLVRDGRDTAESVVKARMRVDYESAFRYWAEGARELLEFVENRGKDLEMRTWTMVRYEELVNDPESAGRAIASFLGRDDVVIDAEVIKSLPVYGSSDTLSIDDLSTWRVTKKPERFNPVGQWVAWDDQRRDQFREIAGRELITLGYESDPSW